MLITDTPSPQAFGRGSGGQRRLSTIFTPLPHRQAHNGDATREQIQGYCGRTVFITRPLFRWKDAAIMANCPMRKPGANGCSGSSTTTAATARTAGLKPGCGWGSGRFELRRSAQRGHVLPGVRFAVDAYLNFARRACWQEAACSSLTELFALQIHQSRLTAGRSTIHGSKRKATFTSAVVRASQSRR